MAEMHQELCSVIREKSVLSGLFDKFEATTKMNRNNLVYALGAFVALLYLVNLAGPAVTHVITTAWPVLGSLRAMDRQSVDLQQKWLGYWMLYAFVNSFEWIFARLQRTIKRIYLFKLLVLVTCALPHPMCPARLVYARFLRRRVWLDSGAAPPGSSPAMTATVVDHMSVSRTSDGHESPSKKKPPQHPPKKPVPAAKKGSSQESSHAKKMLSVSVKGPGDTCQKTVEEIRQGNSIEHGRKLLSHCTHHEIHDLVEINLVKSFFTVEKDRVSLLQSRK